MKAQKKALEFKWKYWSEPEHIKKWNNASEDWQSILEDFKKYTEGI